jgi:hypothetical protein
LDGNLHEAATILADDVPNLHFDQINHDSVADFPVSEETESWTSNNDLSWLDDTFGPTNDVDPMPDIFTDLDSPPSFPTEDQFGHEQSTSEQRSLICKPPKTPRLLYTPVDVSTMLMEYWFSDVCPMWSAFDSPANPHRQLASKSWQHSGAVYYALQSMSAACLADDLPHVKKLVSVHTSQAIQAIQGDIKTWKQSGLASEKSFPKEVLLAIIAMGTSLCWTDTRQLGMFFLQKAHEVLADVESIGPSRSESSRQELLYFREALVYWEMLYRVLGWDPQDVLKKKKEVYRQRIRQAMFDDPDSVDDAPAQGQSPPTKGYSGEFKIHPWTGISTDIQHTFGLVVLLCREHRMASKRQDARSTKSLTEALCDIKLANDFARELGSIDFYSSTLEDAKDESQSRTGDSATPLAHLVDTAEAYRLAALLLLHQTFSDIEHNSLADGLDDATSNIEHANSNKAAQQRRNALYVAMRLVETLRRVPPESGTRCIQPILYISAGSGLRFDPPEGAPVDSMVVDEDKDSFRSNRPATGRSAGFDLAILSKPPTANANLSPPPNVTTCDIEVSRARRFVVDRLCALQRSLPPKPLQVALDLVNAIWDKYDCSMSDSDDVHWIDVMVEKGLQTLFG